ncbi:MAG TPA: sulfite reductase subunit alpha [Stellaceae bacterium]|nr:sulfite reductase subunit alpha [Stellaceae bacterium]
MGYIPRLPENAPFTLAQRAWLDGYLAALFVEPEAAPAPEAQAAPTSSQDEAPWHDPLLSLDERLALAEGRPREQVMMAAMAQLDCGQCGYLCRTYAEAIARGAEANLGRCIPGGKATSRKLKQLVTATASAPAPATVAAPPALPGRPQGPDVRFAARLRAATCLNLAGAEKDTRLIVLEPEEAVSYAVGSSLGVIARNASELVDAVIARLGARPDTPVLCPDGAERPLVAALSTICEIRRPSDQAIEVLASRALDRSESQILQAMAEGYPGAGPEDADLLDLLETFSSARPPLSELVSALAPLQPRLYSIASSPKREARTIELAVAPVRYERRGRRRGGVASTFLCDRLALGEPVAAFLQPSANFHLAPPDAPIVMIGPGTGIAPFRAFLQERRATAAPGRNWLFFGNPHRDSDFFFEDELAGYLRDGLLTRLDTAFSRDQAAKLYVQHRMLEHAAELWAWLEGGAHLYICGDALRMARDVERGLAYIVAKQGRMDEAAAKAYLARLVREGRYQKDVY